MFNFREELKKIQEKKDRIAESKELIIQNFFRSILDQIEAKETFIIKEMELHFGFYENKLYVREENCGENTKRIFYEVCLDEPMESRIVFILIKEQLEKEGYEILKYNIDSNRGSFTVMIKL